jgi:hypothetical protein
MILLYLILDICFWNFTSIKTTLFLIPIIKKDKIFFIILFGLIIDFIISNTYGLFSFILVILIILNKKIKLDYQNIYLYFIRFILIEIAYLILIYLIFKNIGINIIGFIINIIFLVLLDI